MTVDVAQLRLWVFGTSEERISQVLIAADSVGELDNPLRFTDLKRLKCKDFDLHVSFVLAYAT